MSRPELTLVSVVVPVFEEAAGISELRRAFDALEPNAWGDRYEVVLVDDGSRDETWRLLGEWAREDDRVTLVRLAGNRGAHRAARAGLEAASGDACVVIPADLQEGVDLVHTCVDRWHRGGKPVVMMVPRRGRIYARRIDALAARVFYGVLRLSSRVYRGVPVRAQVKLLDRVAADAFARQAPATVLRAPFVLQQRLPFDIVEYDVRPRLAGSSKWGLSRKIALVLDLLVDASSWLLSPWRVGALGLVAVAAFETLSTMSGSAVAGLAARLAFAATTLVMLSILGMQIGRIHQELRARPIYVVSDLRRGKVGADRCAARAARAACVRDEVAISSGG